jgi:2-polyprenylphenol 6-hydroxylase
MHKNKTYDIAIIGTGIVGLTQAALLAKNNLKIICIDKKLTLEKKLDLTNWDMRVSAITPTSTKIWEDLRVWDEMKNLRAYPFKKMHVWDEKSNAHIDFCANSMGQDYLGHLVENKVITYSLFKKLIDTSDIEFLQDDLLDLRYESSSEHKSENKSEYKWEIKTKNSDSIYTKLLIGADGANSYVREKVNIDVTYKSYEQMATVCTLKTQKPLQQCAWQNFLTTGPLAYLPLDENTASIVWSQDKASYETTKKLEDIEFEKIIAEKFNNKFGDVKLLSPRLAFPLIRSHAKTYVKDGLALIGDAAHRAHPLAGQGANLGILDAQALSKVIIKALNKSRDFNTHTWLKKYEQLRWLDNQNMMLSMSGFNSLFSNEDEFLMKLRNFGLSTFNKSSMFKRFCVMDR